MSQGRKQVVSMNAPVISMNVAWLLALLVDHPGCIVPGEGSVSGVLAGSHVLARVLERRTGRERAVTTLSLPVQGCIEKNTRSHVTRSTIQMSLSETRSCSARTEIREPPLLHNEIAILVKEP